VTGLLIIVLKISDWFTNNRLKVSDWFTNNRLNVSDWFANNSFKDQ